MGAEVLLLIQVTAIHKSFGDNEVLQDVSFEAGTDGITGLLGPNGAGKTTTLRILSTLLRPTKGRVAICGHDSSREPESVRKCLGLLTEEPGLYDRLTLREQLTFSAQAFGVRQRAIRERFADLVEMLNLSAYADARAATLSKGTRQKAALARALIHDPPVLLLDEPTASLDIESTHRVHEFLRSDRFMEKTVLLSTHMIEEAERLCKNIVCISGGRVVASGPTQSVVDGAGAPDLRAALLSLVMKNDNGD